MHPLLPQTPLSQLRLTHHQLRHCTHRRPSRTHPPLQPHRRLPVLADPLLNVEGHQVERRLAEIGELDLFELWMLRYLAFEEGFDLSAGIAHFLEAHLGHQPHQFPLQRQLPSRTLLQILGTQLGQRTLGLFLTVESELGCVGGVVVGRPCDFRHAAGVHDNNINTVNSLHHAPR